MSTATPLPSGLRFSVIAHAAVLMAILFGNLIFPNTPLKYQSSLRVDLVGLPDQLKNQTIATPPAFNNQKLAESLKSIEQAAKKLESQKKIPPQKLEERPLDKGELTLKPQKKFRESSIF